MYNILNTPWIICWISFIYLFFLLHVLVKSFHTYDPSTNGEKQNYNHLWQKCILCLIKALQAE